MVPRWSTTLSRDAQWIASSERQQVGWKEHTGDHVSVCVRRLSRSLSSVAPALALTVVWLAVAGSLVRRRKEANTREPEQARTSG